MPKEKAKIFCNAGDGVCNAAFSISAAHLSYTTNGDIGKAVDFIASVLK
jgi:cutinase